MEFFKNCFDGLECSYRKGLILMELYMVYCLQCRLHFSDLKIKTVEGTLLLLMCETQDITNFLCIFDLRNPVFIKKNNET